MAGGVYAKVIPARFKQKGLNKKEKEQVKSIQLNRMEKKYIVDSVNTGVISTLKIDCLTGSMTQGDSASTRDGDFAFPTYLSFSGTLYRNSGSSSGITDSIRVFIFQWKEEETVANIEALLEANLLVGGEVGFKQYPTSQKVRFRMLYDNTFVIGDKTNPPIKFKTRVKNMSKIVFSAGGLSATNHIGIGYLGLYASGIENSNINYSVKLDYTDS